VYKEENFEKMKNVPYLDENATWVMATIVLVTLVPIFAPSTIGITLKEHKKRFGINFHLRFLCFRL